MNTNNFPSIQTSRILTEKDMEETLGGICNVTCKSCHSGSKTTEGPIIIEKETEIEGNLESNQIERSK